MQSPSLEETASLPGLAAVTIASTPAHYSGGVHGQKKEREREYPLYEIVMNFFVHPDRVRPHLSYRFTNLRSGDASFNT